MCTFVHSYLCEVSIKIEIFRVARLGFQNLVSKNLED